MDTGVIEKFLTELERSEEIHDVAVNVNFGYYEVNIIYPDHETRSISVILTKFDGVVIADRRKHYRNNQVETLVLSLLSNDRRCN